MRALIVILAVTAFALNGCGQKGSLYREPASENADEESRKDED